MRASPILVGFTALVLWLLLGCGSFSRIGPTPTPKPAPVATPIPGYAAGEEAQAYESFLKFYADEIENCSVSSRFLDIHFPGTAVYLGDGLWQFYIRIGLPNSEHTEYTEVTVKRLSFPGRTWESKCPDFSTPQAPNYHDDRYYPEPPDEDFVEPPEDSPFDTIRGHPDG